MNIFGFRPFKGKFNLGNSDDIPENVLHKNIWQYIINIPKAPYGGCLHQKKHCTYHLLNTMQVGVPLQIKAFLYLLLIIFPAYTLHHRPLPQQAIPDTPPLKQGKNSI